MFLTKMPACCRSITYLVLSSTVTVWLEPGGYIPWVLVYPRNVLMVSLGVSTMPVVPVGYQVYISIIPHADIARCT